MIVTCTSCKARFRIPDERIGPKGAKVRCSKCKSVFLVKPGAAADGAARAADPFQAPPDPFAGAPPTDPFAAAPPADPFAAAPPADPFAATGAPPVALPPPSGSSAGAHHLPVTDLSDLAGSQPSPPPASLEALAPPLPAAPPAPAAEPAGAVTSADDLVLEEPSRAIPMAPPPIPSAAPAFDFSAGADLAEPFPAEVPGAEARFEFGAPGSDLSDPSAEPVPGLETGPAAVPVPGGIGFTGADPFSGSESPAAPLPGHEGLPHGIPTVTEPLPAEKPPVLAPPRPAMAARRKAGADAGPLSLPRPRSRLAGFAANVVSLAALLAVAAGLLSWWLRDVGPERAGGGTAALATSGVSSGLYEAAGPPVLFVRGEVTSRAAAPVGRVAVRAEVVVGGEVRARAEGVAGAIPTAEEVAQIAGPEDAARLRARVAPRAPQHLEPGGSLPFLVVFDAIPEGFRDATIHVTAEASSRTARAP